MYKYSMIELRNVTIEKLRERGIEVDEMAAMVLELQKKYNDKITIDDCIESVMKVLAKREVDHAVLTGLALDEMANKKLLPEPIQDLVETDEGLFGVDEILVLGITNVFGSIGLTNFGYLDKEKPGLIGELDARKSENEVTTFADDIVSAIIAAAAAHIAHNF